MATAPTGDARPMRIQGSLADLVELCRAAEKLENRETRVLSRGCDGFVATLVLTPSDSADESPIEAALGCLIAWGRDHMIGDRPIEAPLVIARREAAGVHLGLFAVPSVSLTECERTVAELAGRNLGNSGIARRLRKKPKTVANQLTSVFRKLNVQTRAELAKFAFLTLSQSELDHRRSSRSPEDRMLSYPGATGDGQRGVRM